MAILMSENQINYARKKFYGKIYVTKSELNLINKIVNKTLINIYLLKYTLVNIKRKIFRKLHNFIYVDNLKSISFKINLEKNSINKISDNLKLNNFAFIENFLSEESHEYLINNWPNINYFDHNKKIIKHYNSKLEWSLKNSFSKPIYSKSLKNFYEYLLSEEFKKIYMNLTKYEKKNYTVTGISSSMAARGSYLIPHIDGIKNKSETNQDYNFIYFVDGYDENPTLGGGTGFYKDNEFQSPIFIPPTIRNSLIIYNQSENFYHGFKTINCPKTIYRKAINFQIKPV